MTQLDAVRVVEAALFSSGKPLLEEEIAEATQLKPAEVRDALKALSKQYAESESALEVSKAGQKWAMQLKGRYTERARKLARMEVPAKVLRTLALIAFHQPIKQSELKDMVGSVVYDHVKELHERGMVVARADGVTKLLTTSPRFPEYFGLDATDRDGIRSILAERVGLDPEKVRREAQQTLPEGDDTEAAERTAVPQEDPEAATSPEDAAKAPSDDAPSESDDAEDDSSEALKATTA